MTPPDPKAFVKLGSFQKVLAWFKGETRIAVANGDVAQLPGGGKALRFRDATGPPPFKASIAPGGIRLAGGFIGWAGRTIYFPEAVYTGDQPGGVFLKVWVDFNVASNPPVVDPPDPTPPWDIVVDETNPPVIVWRSDKDFEAGPGQHARILDNEPGYEEDLSVTEGIVYLPIATQYNGKVVQDFANAVDLYHIESGTVRMAQRPGPNN